MKIVEFANSIDPDEVAHHLDLLLFGLLVFELFIRRKNVKVSHRLIAV